MKDPLTLSLGPEPAVVSNTFDAHVARSTSRYGKRTLRIYDPKKGRLAATLVNEKMFDILDNLDVELGDEIEVCITYRKKP